LAAIDGSTFKLNNCDNKKKDEIPLSSTRFMVWCVSVIPSPIFLLDASTLHGLALAVDC